MLLSVVLLLGLLFVNYIPVAPPHNDLEGEGGDGTQRTRLKGHCPEVSLPP